ncbi:MAG: bifunctional 4-hydroxy-2-oxoglutarate aldolase/2-dehydro-3-deoxy-phosphogluconate aldolase, partial [Planctomycetia bacterium]|nr:bifunctional 4-hydroxy-2-oxoglutarate aldolase/2-dehydro-3-deoxy-phosphogluconate aldolase [Planctomycetia bacterium]
RIVEFTNRTPAAVEVFRDLAEAAAEQLPAMTLGAGTIINREQAEAFHTAGAKFIVAPNLNDDVGRVCAERGLPWCPGTGTVSEMIRAHQQGAALIKVFPADALGGPTFIKAVRGPCPWLKLMPSGGVRTDEANLRAWFAAGVHCVGIGSDLIDRETLAAGRYSELADRTRRLVSLLAEIAPA